jgi:alpha-L-arabinofuranosidase
MNCLKYFRLILFFGFAPLAMAQTNAVQIRVDAAQIVRTVDARLFGVNVAVWDSQLDTPGTLAALREMDWRTLRFPGGSASDDYHWALNKSGADQNWPTSFAQFTHVATNLDAQVFITVNYGSGTPEEAAAWVRFANITNRLGFKYWEIGNENYGSWEHDENARPHDPVIYATRANDFISQMKAADPTIKIGVVAVETENEYANYPDHPVTNPRTGRSHAGWTPVMLTTLKQLGAMPDFVIYHRYAQNSGRENDARLLQSAAKWTADAASLRQQLNDYLGDAGTNVELICTENNSVSDKPGKQTTSLVNGLFLADSLGQIMQTEFNALVWWDLWNGQDRKNNNSPALYGWRDYGDYGILSGNRTRYPTFYTAKLLKFFARGGDQIVRAGSDDKNLSAYAARRADGSLTLLVINKSPTNSLTADFSLDNFSPATNATIFSYGIPQDEAARTGTGSPDIAQEQFSGAAANFSRSFAPYSASVILLSPSAKK